MFVTGVQTLVSHLRRGALLLRAFALLEDAADHAPPHQLAAPLPALAIPRETFAPQPASARQFRAPHAHRVQLTPIRRARRPGAPSQRAAVCLTPVSGPPRRHRSTAIAHRDRAAAAARHEAP
jgi:hypothetical protein